MKILFFLHFFIFEGKKKNSNYIYGERKFYVIFNYLIFEINEMSWNYHIKNLFTSYLF